MDMTITERDLARRLAIIIPTLNEVSALEGCIASLARGLSCFSDISLTVVDGGSTDGTQALTRRLMKAYPNLELLHNAQRIQSAGVNRAVAALPPQRDLFVRCDAHASYPQGFVYRVCRAMMAHGATSLVVPMDAIGVTCFQKANAWVVDTPFGSGGAPHRGGRKSGFVAHGHHAGFDRRFFEKIGGYDTDFTHNEDAEFDTRALKAKGKIYLDADIRISYQPRGTFAALWRQYYCYGRGRARTVFKSRQWPALRQLIPVVNLVAMVLAVIMAPFFTASLVWPLIYGGVLCGISLGISVKHRSLCGVMSGLALGCMHVSWALGFCVQSIFSLNAKGAARQ